MRARSEHARVVSNSSKSYIARVPSILNPHCIADPLLKPNLSKSACSWDQLGERVAAFTSGVSLNLGEKEGG